MMTAVRIDPAGWPFVTAALLPAAASFVVGWPVPGAMFTVLAIFFLFFFRDPDRQIPADSGVVVAPADGRVVHAGPPEPNVAPPGSWQQISIFLSPLDVHVNRAPIGGRVTRVRYHPGSSCRHISRRRPRRTSAMKSGSSTRVKPSYAARWSAFSPGGLSVASRRGP